MGVDVYWSDSFLCLTVDSVHRVVGGGGGNADGIGSFCGGEVRSVEEEEVISPALIFGGLLVYLGSREH